MAGPSHIFLVFVTVRDNEVCVFCMGGSPFARNKDRDGVALLTARLELQIQHNVLLSFMHFAV